MLFFGTGSFPFCVESTFPSHSLSLDAWADTTSAIVKNAVVITDVHVSPWYRDFVVFGVNTGKITGAEESAEKPPHWLQ